MGSDTYVVKLEEARTILLAERRRLAESMIEFAGAASAVQGPLFVRAQEAIEAIDRAIEDERRLSTPNEISHASHDDRLPSTSPRRHA